MITGVEAWISVRDGTWHLNLFSGGPTPTPLDAS